MLSVIYYINNVSMQKITPFLWFDNQAEEAAKFYTSLFKNWSIGKITLYTEGMEEVSKKPLGSVMVVEFEIDGLQLAAMNGWPFFKVNPSISFYVTCQSVEEIDTYWNALIDGGKALMELGKYEWSEKYGRVEDKFGVSWQLFVGQEAKPIRPCMMFANAVAWKAEEAMNLYTSIFKESKIIFTYPHQTPLTWIAHAVFNLEWQEFIAMDSHEKHGFDFSEWVSFAITTDGQDETDYFRDKLIADWWQESQCGWLKDKFGFSWQVTPKQYYEYAEGPDPERAKKSVQEMLKMRKIDISKLKEAYEG